MSFRIDDILKQNSKELTNISPDNSTKTEYNSDVNTLCDVKNTSILEYTLTNRNYYSAPVQHELHHNKYSTNYETNNIRDPYLAKPSTRCSYPRDPIWTPYMPYPVMFNCPYLHTRRKGGQIRFTTSQTEELEKQFNSHKYLSPEDRKQLADFLRLSDRQVKTWFQNRRAKWRRNNQICSTRPNDLVMTNLRETGLSDVSSRETNQNHWPGQNQSGFYNNPAIQQHEAFS